MPLLRAEKLTVDFGTRRALGPVNMAIEAGERLAIVGESGAGKSLLGLALLNLLPPDARRGGALTFEDKPLPGNDTAFAPLRGRRLGFAAADAEGAFDPLRRVGGELRAAARRSRDAVLPAAFRQLVADLGLDPERLNLLPAQLNPGERQLALLAMALLPSPDVLIADEPGAALDPVARRRALDVIAAVSDRRKIAVILLTREPRIAALLCRDAIVLRDGKVADSGRSDVVLARPRDEYVRGLIAAGRPRVRALMRSPLGTDLLEVRHVTRRFGRGPFGFGRREEPALNDVSFSVKSAEAIAIVGPAGAGKSALARIIAGLDRADSGEMGFGRLTYRGRDLPRDFRSEIGLVSGNANNDFDPRLTAFDVVDETLQLQSLVDADARPGRVVGAVSLMGLPREALDRRAAELSPPDALRLALARALVTRPRLLLLDEPVAGLDTRPRAELTSLIGRLRADLGITVLVFTRDIETVRGLADRVLVLDHGQIVESGRPGDLLASPRHRVTETLVRARLPELV